MNEQERIKLLHRRLTQTRTELISTYPFFGRLLLHLPLAFAECGTACTDMKNIIFDPDFAEQLDDEQLRFVFLHELMHCVLKHCTRGIGLDHNVYNIACDIVVNSCILDMLRTDDFLINGNPVMHLAPDETEGRLHTAEEVYKMLLSNPQKEESGPVDNHEIWDEIADSVQERGKLEDIWTNRLKTEAARISGSASDIPCGLQRYLREITDNPRTNWKQLIHDFIQHDKSDYTFQIPDRRFQDDIILPSFQDEMYGEKIEKLWFAVDTSGSISDETLQTAFNEIFGAVSQVQTLTGWISSFDTEVSEPVEFSSVEDVRAYQPVGCGGTSFTAIFESIDKYFPDEYPKLIIIITDGYAYVPEKEMAKGIPVFWIIIDSDVEPEWGTVAHI